MSATPPDGLTQPATARPGSTRRPGRSPASAKRRSQRAPGQADLPADLSDLPPHTVVIDGQRLRDARHRRRVSRADLAWDSGIGISTIERLERRPAGPRTCRARTLARIAIALGEPPLSLMPDGVAAALGLQPVSEPDGGASQGGTPTGPEALSA